MKILIVEDDPMVAHINKKFANKAGYDDVETVADIQSAKNRISQGDISLVLLDVYLPTGKGTDLLIWIREQGYNTDVILITADRSSETVERAMNFGALDYLLKPFDFTRFKAAMDKFEKKHNNFAGKVNIEQDDIDNLFFDSSVKNDDSRMESPDKFDPNFLDKGMSEKTYFAVLNAIRDTDQATTAEELGDKLGISRVSVRRYLEFMEQKGMLTMELVYGKKGRPQHLFKYIKKGN
ncbi:MAG: response regulator [Spirochaetia bacterium]|nr:response regulator [Spirochaetia bacterium]